MVGIRGRLKTERNENKKIKENKGCTDDWDDDPTVAQQQFFHTAIKEHCKKAIEIEKLKQETARYRVEQEQITILRREDRASEDRAKDRAHELKDLESKQAHELNLLETKMVNDKCDKEHESVGEGPDEIPNGMEWNDNKMKVYSKHNKTIKK